MVEITIEVPEALAERLSSLRDRLPEVLARGLDEPSPLPNEVYRYILEFLANNPSPEAVLNFSLTSAMQQRASELLEKNRTGQLTPGESNELDEYVRIDHIVSMLKARALKNVKVPS